MASVLQVTLMNDSSESDGASWLILWWCWGLSLKTVHVDLKHPNVQEGIESKMWLLYLEGEEEVLEGLADHR